MKKHVVLLLFFFASLATFAQRNLKDTAISTPWVAVHYGYNWTAQDLSKVYGPLNHLGAMAGYKTTKNWVWGFDGNFMFGNKVRLPNLLDQLADSYGNVTDETGSPAIIQVNARGFNANLMVGKVIPIFGSNANSGLYMHGGLGYVQYKARVESQDQVIPTIELKYKKGYDRYKTGLNFHQFIGYAFLSDHGFYNFYGGFYIQEGLTKYRREINFDEPDVPVEKNVRLDVQYGFKVGWFIPIYKRKPKDFYFD